MINFSEYSGTYQFRPFEWARYRMTIVPTTVESSERIGDISIDFAREHWRDEIIENNIKVMEIRMESLSTAFGYKRP